MLGSNAPMATANNGSSAAASQGSGNLLDDIGAGYDMNQMAQRHVVNTKFVKTPFKPVVQKTQAGSQKQATGIEVHAAMMRLK